ncbi:hypothetical protein GJ744_006639 [Endocarpon pusillum]|uniref:Uncharacterized protein n=1 Tax=Endocarpon pusillum TaxID=364733 RepID=A0A8H7AZK1_9EURO|nr:hypothetical protein GJ744_006639 [Endocarpon pusillum]
MSPGNGTSGTGGVRNLRALFENKPSEDRSASPPSRGRSPAHSEASLHSRPVSNVRATFIAVERPGDFEEGQHWGLRKISDVTTMADIKQEPDKGSLVNRADNTSNGADNTSNGAGNTSNGAGNTSNGPDNTSNGAGNTSNGAGNTSDLGPQPSSVHDSSESKMQQSTAESSTPGGLGGILKGSDFEASPPSEEQATGAREPPKSPTPQRTSLPSTRPNANPSPGSLPKSTIGSRIKDAVSSNHNHPPPPTKLNTTKDAKPIKPPPTRRVPPTKPSPKSPTSPRSPRAPRPVLSPKMGKPVTRGSGAKPVAVAESAKSVSTSDRAKMLPASPKEPRSTALSLQGTAAARQAPASPKTNESQKDAKPSSPEARSRSTRVSASLTAPTAASAAKSGNPTTLGRKPTVTRREPPPAKIAAPTAPVIKKPTRSSLSSQANGPGKAQSGASAAKKAHGEGFLARMMRPTTSSAQKAHEKVAPSSPPQAKRAAPAQAAKGKARISMTISDEDKENSHQGGQEIDPSPAAAEAKQPEMNGTSNAEPGPLNDITPAANAEHSAAEVEQVESNGTGETEPQPLNGTPSAADDEKHTAGSNTDALEVSGA